MSDDIKLPELLPCPFCGGEAYFRPYKNNGLTIQCKSFGCVRRDARVLRHSIDWLREVMARDWNKRAAVELNRAVPEGFVLLQKSDVQNLVSYFSGADMGIRYGAAKLSALRAQKLLNTTAQEHGEE